MPFSHLQSTSNWFSKLHGPLFKTHNSWLSKENWNWNKPSPTSIIFKSLPSLQTDRSRFFATRRLRDLVVRNLPIKLREHAWRAFSRWVGQTWISSPSSLVSVILLMRSMKSESMSVHGKSHHRFTRKQAMEERVHTRWEGRLLFYSKTQGNELWKQSPQLQIF